MQLLVVVLNKIEKFDDLLVELGSNDIRGGTIIDTMGMVRTLASNHSEVPMFGNLRMILNENKPLNKTMFMVLPDEKVSIAMDCVRKTVPDIEEENAGVMFTVPVSKAEGLTK